MSAALDAMVKAMIGELGRQAQERGDYFGEIMDGHPDKGRWIIDSAVDLEKVGRAAIEAMREPTGAMLDRGEAEVGPKDSRYESAKECAGFCWEAMIDAALAEPTT